MNIKKLLPGVKRNVLLKNYTTFKIGGPAKYFYIAKAKTDLIEAIKKAKKLNPSPFPKGDRVKLPFFILGGGSNLLVSDKGFNGLVIKFGQPLSWYVSKGLEWAAGIPGTIQGAVYGNSGAFGKSMKDVVESVEVFDTKTEKIKIFKNKDCRFSYRNSIFRKKKNLIILSVKIKSKKVDELRSSPRSANARVVDELRSSPRFAAARVVDELRSSPRFAAARVSNVKKIKQYLDYKKQTQPLNFPSAGSIFKNFTPHRNKISGAGPNELKELKKFQKTGMIPAARLIEECGLKGKKIGNVKISEKHGNFIVNLDGGKAKDVIKLIKLTKKKVKNKFKVNLEEEIQYLP